MQGPPDRVAACFKLLCKARPMFRYFPEPEKSFAICLLAAETEVKAIFLDEDLPVQTYQGHRYVDGHVSSLVIKNRWIEPKVEKWVAAIGDLCRDCE